MKRLAMLLVVVAAVALATTVLSQPGAEVTSLRFEVTMARGLVPDAQDGRLFVILGKGREEPRFGIGATGLDVAPYLGTDARAFVPGKTIILNQTSAIFPLTHLAQLPAGEYTAQAVLHTNRDLNLVNAPGNLFSAPVAVKVDPAAGGVVKIELTKQIPAEELPADTDQIKWIKLKSEKLSAFHRRPMYLRAGVVLPRDFDRNKDLRYPLRVHIGGYGTRS